MSAGPAARSTGRPIGRRPVLTKGGGAAPTDPIPPLFSGGRTGVYLNLSDPATVFADTDGTSPATVNVSTLARINDKSGNGNYARQATGGARPAWKSSGGKFWAESDSLDDFMDLGSAVIAGAVPFSLFLAGRFAAGSTGAMLTQYAAGQPGRVAIAANQNDSGQSSNGRINPFINGVTQGGGVGGSAGLPLAANPGNDTNFVFALHGRSGSEQSWVELNGVEYDRFTLSNVYTGTNAKILGEAVIGFGGVRRLSGLVIANWAVSPADIATITSTLAALN